jgi:hypothetical protein
MRHDEALRTLLLMTLQHFCAPAASSLADNGLMRTATNMLDDASVASRGPSRLTFMTVGVEAIPTRWRNWPRTHSTWEAPLA